MSEIACWRAVDQAAALERGAFSSVELVEACLTRVRAWNPVVNAFVTLDEEGARAAAALSDRRRRDGRALGIADGLVVGVKDLFDTRGLRTTFGSPIHADRVPDRDHLIVERERTGGLVLLGKTNTPEFGAGAQTFNAVFGVTRNPYDPTRTCGGSSGGSAVALACGMASLADGSDFGGSLRAPAAWCNVAGMRPSPGRVPSFPTRLPWNTLSVHGPMARTAADLALFMSVIAGPDPRCPIALEAPSSMFLEDLRIETGELRLAFSPDLGMLPVDAEIAAVCAEALAAFRQLGAQVTFAHPDLRGGSEVFKTLRAAKFALDREADIAMHRDRIKQTILDNAQVGFEQSGLEVSRAEARRAQLWHHVREFMRDHDFMLWPVNPVPPFSADQETLTEVAGVPMQTYVDWGALRHLVSILGLPAVSIPCGFTRDGLPVGLQIIGRPGRDMDVLRLAHAFERETEFWMRRPEPPPEVAQVQ